MKVLIVEDEHFAEQELKRLLRKCPINIQVEASLDTIDSCVQWLQQNEKPDLIFMDIQLSDGLSFEIFNQVEVTSPVIFTTAYDEYAIQAFKVNSIDYLLKPVEQADLNLALEKYQRMKVQFQETSIFITADQIAGLLNFGKAKYKDRFVSKIGDYLNYILIKDVAYFYAEDKTVYLVDVHNQKHIIDYSLDRLEPQLDPEIFFRLNRSFITKLNAIENVAKYFNGRLKIKLTHTDDDNIMVSRDRAAKFKNWLAGEN
ncbi:MAG: DNA-binding response regulator [Cyclobacteriaceae bacterium]|nr:MAG: DNA-binding response regulator [Cyclobacteriaceae bacterium]